MQELKELIHTELTKEFDEIYKIFSDFQRYLGNLTDPEEEYINHQMNVLRSICDSHLAKLQMNLLKEVWEWNKKKEKDSEEEECVNQKRR